MATASARGPRTRARSKWSLPPQADGVTVADLLKQLGDIPPARVRLYPIPGTATEDDVIRVLDHEDRPCELVDGTLVEKAMGLEESIISVFVATCLSNFVLPRKLGFVSGEAGTFKLVSGLVRIPDVAFVSWDRLPGRKLPTEPIPLLAPDLAVEVLSKSNTKREIDRKLREYFAAGTRLAGVIDPEKRIANVYTSARRSKRTTENQALDGGSVLPGFVLPLQEVLKAGLP
jgi:Uma2 family endonuclease